ncbi:MAG: glycosyltransferase [Bacteroidaceae bacterium]|nr:glycosyltransferase [Bacteroidaceae bacterium]
MISVCIATYNGEKYLRQQLDSILAQMGKDDEIVISDDCSTDGTLELIESSYHDKRIRVVHHDPTSIKTTFPLDKPTHNFENALMHAKGDIIFLADQDDVWLPGKVNKMLHVLETADMAMHDCIIADTELKQLAPSYFDIVKVTTNVWRNVVKCTMLGCCMAMRRSVVERALPFPKTKVGHDLWLGMVAGSKFRFTLVREPLLMYRKHGTSMTTAGGESKYGLWFKINYRLTILRQLIKLL